MFFTKMIRNQSAEQKSVINFWWLRTANHEKFTEECVVCMEKHVSEKVFITNELNMTLLPQVWVPTTKAKFTFIE